MSKILEDYKNSSMAFKVATAPMRLMGWGPGVLYRTIAETITKGEPRRPVQAPSLNPLAPHLGLALVGFGLSDGAKLMAKLDFVSEETAETLNTAVANVEHPTFLIWLLSSVVVDVATGFRALRTGFTEMAGERSKPSAPKYG